MLTKRLQSLNYKNCFLWCVRNKNIYDSCQILKNSNTVAATILQNVAKII